MVDAVDVTPAAALSLRHVKVCHSCCIWIVACQMCCWVRDSTVPIATQFRCLRSFLATYARLSHWFLFFCSWSVIIKREMVTWLHEWVKRRARQWPWLIRYLMIKDWFLTTKLWRNIKLTRGSRGDHGRAWSYKFCIFMTAKQIGSSWDFLGQYIVLIIRGTTVLSVRNAGVAFAVSTRTAGDGRYGRKDIST